MSHGRNFKSSGGVEVSARGLSQRYRIPGGGELAVLENLDLELVSGERVAIVGRSGAGKTTLLALLGGLERLQRGELRVGDVDLTMLGGDDLAGYRRETVGFVFQHFGLVDSLTALENVELAMSIAAVNARDRRARVHMGCWTRSVLRTARTIFRVHSAAVSVSVLRSPGRWRTIRVSFLLTSRVATWTRIRPS